VTEEIKIAAAKAIAGLVKESELSADYILPKAMDKKIAGKVAKVVMESIKK
jgi:malate dehydrogenase (oxaloacetate-decarboxylating)